MIAGTVSEGPSPAVLRSVGWGAVFVGFGTFLLGVSLGVPPNQTEGAVLVIIGGVLQIMGFILVGLAGRAERRSAPSHFR